MPIFHSVILAGVYKLKNQDFSTGKFVQRHKFANVLEKLNQYNSPWNIAASFKIDMSFSATQIAGMLQEYEDDYHTGMDIQSVAGEIYAYTSGYPVLVSAICKYIDEDILEDDASDGQKKPWSKHGVARAVKSIQSRTPRCLKA